MPMKMSGLKCSYSTIKGKAKSKPQRRESKVLKGMTLSYSKVLRSLLRICFSNVDIGVISRDNPFGSQNSLSDLSSLKDPLQQFVKCSNVSMKSSDLRKEGFIPEFKANLSAPDGLRPHCDSVIPQPLVEWRIVETSMEDGLLARAAVNRNEYTGYKFEGANIFGATKCYTEQNKESGNHRDLAMKELDLMNGTSASSDEHVAFARGSKGRRISMEPAMHCPPVQSGSSKEDLFDAAKNHANKQENCGENDDSLSEDRDWNIFKEDIRKRRRFGEFPPPLASLSGKRSSKLPHEAACLQLQRIRSNGRFVLQEIKTPPQAAFQPIRSQGRLILQLINQNNEDATRISSRLAPPQEVKIEKSNYELINKFDEAAVAENAPVVSSSPVSHNDLDQNDTLSMNASNKQETRESILHESMRQWNFSVESQTKNADTVAVNLDRSSKDSDLKHYITYSADFLDNHLPRKRSAQSARNTEANLYENNVGMSDPTSSLLRFSLFNMRDMMNGVVDSASNLRCKGFERREEDYIAAWESRCVASS